MNIQNFHFQNNLVLAHLSYKKGTPLLFRQHLLIQSRILCVCIVDSLFSFYEDQFRLICFIVLPNLNQINMNIFTSLIALAGFLSSVFCSEDYRRVYGHSSFQLHPTYSYYGEPIIGHSFRYDHRVAPQQQYQ